MTLDPRLSARIFGLMQNIAALPEVRTAVEANHDDNRWWPTAVTDPRIRMLVAGWSTRISYSVVETYARVVAEANALGFDELVALDDGELTHLVRPLGLPVARIGYLRSLTDFVEREGNNILDSDANNFIHRFAKQVHHASFKVAQCAVLYARGYHCGIIPVDGAHRRRGSTRPTNHRLAPHAVMDLCSGAGAELAQSHDSILDQCPHF
jgi:hypothetical protein